jgi:hypothetical protein
MGYEDTARLDIMQASNAKRQASSKAGSAILLGAGKAYSQWPAGGGAQTGYNLGDYEYGNPDY